jgi:outer membrane receptor protein involved in Fe transport
MFKKQILASAISIISMSALAGEAVFYVTEDGEAVNNISVMVDGQKKLVGKNGFVTFDLKGGNHKVELSQFGEFAGEFDFDAAANQNAEVQVEMIAGEAVQEVSVYTPGQEQTVALGKVSGYLESEETGGGVEGALISVEATDLTTVTNSEGFYELEIPRGEYTLNVAHPSYGNRQVKKLRVISNVATNVNLNMSMSGDSMIEEVVAVGSYIPSTATAQQRDSSAVLSAIGSEEMSRFGDSSAASALKRVSGVSLVGGQFAVIRGLKGRYISSTLNGSAMPSTDPMKRDVPLDLFPSSVLGGIAIQKSYTPNLPGDTTGGSIQMTTKGLPDEEQTKISVGLGFNTQVTGQDVITYEGSNTDFLGFDDGLRDVPSTVDSATNGGERGSIGELCASGCDFTFSDLSSLLGDFENIYNTDTTTALPNIKIGLSHSNRVEVDGGDFGYYGAVEYQSKWSTREDAYIDSTSGEFDYERSQFKVDLTGYLVAGFEMNSGDEYLSKTTFLRKTDDTTKKTVGVDSEDVTIEDYTLQWVERQFFSQQFSGVNILNDENQIEWRTGLSLTNRYEPDRRTYQFRNEVLPPELAERRFSDLNEIAVDLGVDHAFESYVGEDTLLKIKTGALINLKDRELQMARYSVRPGPGDADATTDMEEALSEVNLDNNAYILDVATTNTDSYDATEEMFALYQSYEVDIAGEYVFLFGGRFESATQELKYEREPDSNNSLETSEFLPVASATWRANEELQFRVGYSDTVARPGLTELSKSASYDPDTDEVIKGNPDLELSYISNIDFRAEYYFSSDESVALALFAKNIDKPIEKTIPDASGSSSDGYIFVNSQEATLSGIEIDFRKDTLDTDNWMGFVSGNLAFIDSEVTLADASATLEGVDSRELQGQSEVLANIQFGFDHLVSGQNITILANYFGDRIDKVSRGPSVENEYEKGRTQIDMTYSWDVSDALTIKGKASNLTNEPVEYTQNDKVIESYKNGTDITVSADWIF